MDAYTPPEDFTDKVMARVQLIRMRQQRQVLVFERMLGMLPVKALLSLAAVVGGLWNLLRLYMVLSPAICK